MTTRFSARSGALRALLRGPKKAVFTGKNANSRILPPWRRMAARHLPATARWRISGPPRKFSRAPVLHIHVGTLVLGRDRPLDVLESGRFIELQRSPEAPLRLEKQALAAAFMEALDAGFE